jgi:hypothetical protein
MDPPGVAAYQGFNALAQPHGVTDHPPKRAGAKNHRDNAITMLNTWE